MEYEHRARRRASTPVLALVHRAPVTMATIGDGIGGAFGVLMEHAGTHGVHRGPVRRSSSTRRPATASSRSPSACRSSPGPTGGERATVEEVPGGLVRLHRARRVPTPRSARPTWRCRSG